MRYIDAGLEGRMKKMLVSEARRVGGWLVVMALVAGSWVFGACSDDASTTPTDAADAASDGASSSGEAPAGTATVATEPGFKVAFIGDTAAGDDFKSVLQLIKRENAQAVMIQGDLTYSGDTAADWFPAADGELEAAKIPYFVSRGNHDVGWKNESGLGPGLDERLTKWGITPESDKPSLANYSVVHRGLKMVFVDQAETEPSRADYVKARFESDPHIWRICSWHKNQRATNVGPKEDEMGWEIYENCRAAGAIVAQGHSHTYSRSVTITLDQEQTVDEECADPFSLCVGPGKHFFFDSSLGGVDIRTMENTKQPYWASTYAAEFGALFLEFNVDGDPRKARGYFKTVGDVVVDPPPSSGQEFFTITSTN